MQSALEYNSEFASQGMASRKQVFVWGCMVAFVLTLVVMIIGAPVALSHGYTSTASVIYKIFSPLCHQISARSFHVDNHPFAVCARCTGIYAGFATGVIFYPLMRTLGRRDTPARKWLFLSIVPIFVDWTLGVTGIWANTHLSRVLTGGLFGTVCALYVVPGFMDLIQSDWRHFFASRSLEEDKRPTPAIPISPNGTTQSDFGSPTSRI